LLHVKGRSIHEFAVSRLLVLQILFQVPRVTHRPRTSQRGICAGRFALQLLLLPLSRPSISLLLDRLLVCMSVWLDRLLRDLLLLTLVAVVSAGFLGARHPVYELLILLVKFILCRDNSRVLL